MKRVGGMKVFLIRDKTWLIRLDYGEEVMASLVAFAREKKIRGAAFHGFGSLSDPVLASYDLKKKRYRKRQFRGLYEAAGMTGNLAMLARAPALHCHLVIGGKDLKAYAGHLVSGKAGGTLEISLQKTRPLRRGRDSKTGLNVIV